MTINKRRETIIKEEANLMLSNVNDDLTVSYSALVCLSVIQQSSCYPASVIQQVKKTKKTCIRNLFNTSCVKNLKEFNCDSKEMLRDIKVRRKLKLASPKKFC